MLMVESGFACSTGERKKTNGVFLSVSWYLLALDSWSGLDCGSEAVLALAPQGTSLSRKSPPCKIPVKLYDVRLYRNPSQQSLAAVIHTERCIKQGAQ